MGSRPIPTDMPLEDVLKVTGRFEAVMAPVIENDASSQWMQATEKALPAIRRIVTGQAYYQAYEGVNTALNQVYFIKVLEKLPDGRLRITNPPESGQKKRVKQVEAVIEPDLVYPLIRGKDIKKWYVGYEDRYIIIPYKSNGQIIPPSEMREKYLNTYTYFYNFYHELINRTGGFLKGRLSPYKKLPLEIAEKKTIPFYSIATNIGDYTFAPYKVVWRYVAGAITGKAEFLCAVIGDINDKYLGRKIMIPNEKLMLVPLESADEAYYLSGVLNSTIVRSIVASYVIETEISTHILDFIKVPKYDLESELHRKISELSRRAHELAKEIYEKDRRNLENELRRVEDELDKAVGQLYGLSEEAIEDFRTLLTILSGEEVGEAPNEGESKLKPSVEFLKTDVTAGGRDYIEVSVSTAGSCDRAELTLNAPWGVQRLYLGEGRQRIEVKPLPEGTYDVKYVFKCGDYEFSGVVKVVSGSGSKSPKRPSTLRLG